MCLFHYFKNTGLYGLTTLTVHVHSEKAFSLYCVTRCTVKITPICMIYSLWYLFSLPFYSFLSFFLFLSTFSTPLLFECLSLITIERCTFAEPLYTPVRWFPMQYTSPVLLSVFCFVFLNYWKENWKISWKGRESFMLVLRWFLLIIHNYISKAYCDFHHYASHINVKNHFHTKNSGGVLQIL